MNVIQCIVDLESGSDRPLSLFIHTRADSSETTEYFDDMFSATNFRGKSVNVYAQYRHYPVITQFDLHLEMINGLSSLFFMNDNGLFGEGAAKFAALSEYVIIDAQHRAYGLDGKTFLLILKTAFNRLKPGTSLVITDFERMSNYYHPQPCLATMLRLSLGDSVHFSTVHFENSEICILTKK